MNTKQKVEPKLKEAHLFRYITQRKTNWLEGLSHVPTTLGMKKQINC